MANAQLLRNLHTLRELSDSDLQTIADAGRWVEFERDDVVFKQGDPADHALLLVRGQLQASLTEGEHRRLLGQVRKGDLVGEQGVFGDARVRKVSLVATRPCVALVIDQHFFEAQKRTPLLGMVERHLVLAVARRMQGANRQLQQAWADLRRAEAKKAAPKAAPKKPAASGAQRKPAGSGAKVKRKASSASPFSKRFLELLGGLL